MPRDDTEGGKPAQERERIDDDPGMSRHGSEAQRGAIPDSSEDAGSAAGDVQEQGRADSAQAE